MNETVKQSNHEPIRSSVVLLIMRLFFVMFFVDVLYSIAEVYFLDLDVPSEIHRLITIAMFATHFVKNMFLIYYVLNIVIKWISNIYYVSDKFLVKHRGIVNIKEKTIDLKNLRSVIVNQGLLGRLFNYGNISLTTSASGGYTEETYLAEIDHPEKLKEFFQSCLEKAG